MSPKKSIKGQNKKNGKKLPSNNVLLKCVPCCISFATSNDLIHHVFNDHNFQPNIHLEKVDDSIPEVLNNYISNQASNQRKTPTKPKEKKTPGRKRKTPIKDKDTTTKPKRQRKEKKAPLKAALVDSDGYSIPKIKIARFNTTNAFSIDGSDDSQPSKQEHKEIPLNNRLEPIQNSTAVTSSVITAPSTTSTSNGHTSTTDDGLSSLMSEVYNVLDGQDSTSLSLPTNGDTNSEFLEMREIQGLYDDDMTYTHFASAFEIPQSKSLSNSQSPYPTSSSSLDYNSSNKMSAVDSLSSLSHNLDNLLNKPTPPSSCMLADSTNPYIMNNSLPNHNTASSAFTSTNHKSPSLTNHSSNSSAFMLPSGGTGSGSTGKVVPPSYASPSNKTIPSGYASPNNMMGYTPSSPSPLGVCSSPHKSMSPHVNNVLSPSPSSTPGSPHSDGGKKKTGLNVIPTEKLLDTSSKQNQLINTEHASVSSSYYPLNSMMTSSVSSVAPYGSSYYNSMYPYMNHSSSQFMSSPSHMSSYYNFYPSPSSQPIEDSQYKRVDLPPGPSLLPLPSGPSLHPSGPPGPPPFKRSAEDSQFKRPPEPPNKQPKIVPKKLSTLLPTAGDKKSAGNSGPRLNTPPMPGGPLYSIQQRPSSSQTINRLPGPPPVQIRSSSSIRPPPAPSLKGPRPPGPGPWGTSTTVTAGSPSKPVSVAPAAVDTPAASALAKRGITISSVAKPPTRKLTSSVNITPVVKKSAPTPDRIGGGAVEIVPKIHPPSRPAELIKDAECNLGIPVIDLSNQTVLNKLNMMGITSFIPVNQMRGSNQIMGLPIISTAQANRRMDDLGETLGYLIWAPCTSSNEEPISMLSEKSYTQLPVFIFQQCN
ncbi:hypothetical protein WDU94_014600 [Cyamophila willieti]